MFVRLLIATTNPDKVREIRQLLDGIPFDLVTLAEWPLVAPPEETGLTFEENARAKALYYAAATDELTVAEDSGLAIDALDGAPGVESARFGGADTPYPDKFEMIYEALRARSVSKKREHSPSRPAPPAKNAQKGSEGAARFVCAVALAQGARVLFETRGTVEGRISPEPRGDGGFGYDPIFFYPPYGQTLAEVGDRKAAVSHRGEAFRALSAFLRSGHV